MNEVFFEKEEIKELRCLHRKLLGTLGDQLPRADIREIKNAIADAATAGVLERDRFGFNPIITAMSTACALCESVDADRNMVVAILLSTVSRVGHIDNSIIKERWGDDVAKLVGGIDKVISLYKHNASVESDNFRKLLLTFAEDIRVIIIMLVSRLALMRAINHHPSEKLVREAAYEVNYLYAPLAHRLGLYAIKSELEDMSLKYSNREMYSRIARELNETKAKRDRYIDDFIAPIKARLEAEGLKFDIKGRTKSIYSIWNKMKKQHNTVEDIYDLFAIRIVIDCPIEREKPECWLAYSIVTDMYRPNPGRLKDWLSIPKSNGYESLHITVYGPEERWVEVQIRTRRMDAIAEKGLAAHWKYKGIKSENSLDAWMSNVRDILEAAHTGPMELMRNFKMDVYAQEVFVFTPKGDLYKLPIGATLLDFAFNIHTKIGTQCVGGRVNGRNRKLNYRLVSGDTVEILTSPQQEPSRDWLSIVVTSKAKNKIRAVLKENENRSADLGKELLQRRFKNRKIEFDEATISKTVTRMGYKNTIDFFSALGSGEIEVNAVVDAYLECIARQIKAEVGSERVSAAEYMMMQSEEEAAVDAGSSDIVVIGDNIKGINYRLARCCNPIYGDDVFGFISSEGVIKIHRSDCPNAAHIRSKYAYRLIRTRWSGKAGAEFAATLRVVGKDDIGIVTNITSIINKEKSVTLRSISIDSNDGLFHGTLVVGISDTIALNQLIKKISTVKGVKNVQRNK
ncbi:MAG: bifunctional (p)ppGpp synthetase/guanosine-3',5'-bis(diphosphate) 3'-pyrophosphohydrolase [Muribaculaceae bacterium]|nr:bifunctional (p)ppGpp synthetase/guanosine-3',5'-bis(diphosphate) 3'-pyrophosphohydrolase [Muribaculaceae bacterium]